MQGRTEGVTHNVVLVKSAPPFSVFPIGTVGRGTDVVKIEVKGSPVTEQSQLLLGDLEAIAFEQSSWTR